MNSQQVAFEIRRQMLDLVDPFPVLPATTPTDNTADAVTHVRLRGGALVDSRAVAPAPLYPKAIYLDRESYMHLRDAVMGNFNGAQWQFEGVPVYQVMGCDKPHIRVYAEREE